MSKEFTLNGKTYRPEVQPCECDGCAGDGNPELCVKLPDCEDIVFVEVKPEEAK